MSPAPELGNEVLIDDHWLIRIAGPLFAVLSLLLIPWIAFLATVLPSRQLSRHYDFAWAGFDAMLLIALAATAYFALRRSRNLSVAAIAEKRIALLLPRVRGGLRRDAKKAGELDTGDPARRVGPSSKNVLHPELLA